MEKGGRGGGRGGCCDVAWHAGLTVETIRALGTKSTSQMARETERDMREESTHNAHVHAYIHTYLGVIADKGGAVARIHGAGAEVALDNPHGCLLVPVLLRGSDVQEISAL